MICFDVCREFLCLEPGDGGGGGNAPSAPSGAVKHKGDKRRFKVSGSHVGMQRRKDAEGEGGGGSGRGVRTKFVEASSLIFHPNFVCSSLGKNAHFSLPFFPENGVKPNFHFLPFFPSPDSQRESY